MASVAMEAQVGVVERMPPEPDAPSSNGGYRPLEPGKVSGLHIPEIEAVAERLAKDLKDGRGDDLHLVVEKLGGELSVYGPSAEDSRFSGIQVGEEFGSFRILLPVRSSLPFENVIIAKELGHYFLHHLYSRAKVPSEPSDQDDATDQVALSNSEAEIFALCFLMPRASFAKDIERGMDVPTLASLYGVPETIVGKRIQLLERAK